MQSSLPAEAGNRNIKAVDLADSAEIAKIVGTANQTDGPNATRVYSEIIARKVAILAL
jgi:hypothetical protein